MIKSKNKRTSIGIESNLGKRGRILSKVSNRTFTKQIEHWAKIGELAEANPSLPGGFLNNVLISVEEFSNYGSKQLTMTNNTFSFFRMSSIFKKSYMNICEKDRQAVLNQIYHPSDMESLAHIQGVVYYQGIFVGEQDYYLAYTVSKDLTTLCLLCLYKRQGHFNNTDKIDYYSSKVITLLQDEKE